MSNRHLVGKSFPLFLASERDAFVLRLSSLAGEGRTERWNACLRPRERSAVECAFTAAPDSDGRVLLLVSQGLAALTHAADNGDSGGDEAVK